MSIEIERKFLVTNDGWREGAVGTQYWQGYISSCASHAVRVRIAGEKAFLTIKSGSLDAAQTSRLEFEYPIPVADAEDMLQAICEQGQIRKIRYKIPFKGLVWEVDEFLEENEGLIVAEVELSSPDIIPELPSWIGKEVTTDARYTNAALARMPYKNW